MLGPIAEMAAEEGVDQNVEGMVALIRRQDVTFYVTSRLLFSRQIKYFIFLDKLGAILWGNVQLHSAA